MATSKFFEKLKNHSEIKLRILRKFIKPWSNKLGHKVVLRGESELWYVDGFAGQGKYDDGSEGSPIIAAEHALELLQASRDYALGCVNVELGARRFRRLSQATATYIRDGVVIKNLPGDFSEKIQEILKIVGLEAPLLLFIDPFGLSPLKFDKLRPLIQRPGETDVIITLQTRAAYRLAAEHPILISEAIGSSAWSPDPEKILPMFTENLLKTGRFLAVASYSIREEKGSSARYHLVMASRHFDAFELLNDFVAQEEEMLDRKSYAQMVQSSFIPLLEEQEGRRALIEVVLGLFQTRPRVTRTDIVQQLVLKYWGQWHTSDIKKAVRGLIDSQRIIRLKTGKGSIDTDSLILAS